MFRKTDTNEQLDIFSSPSTYMKGRTAKKYEDPHAWHNEFYQYVTSKIDEETFRPLFKEGNMGAPNASIRILVAMSILKEGFGCSDEDLFEKCEFDLLARKALIAWYSRYEIVHATLRKEMNEFTLPSLNPSLRKKVEEALTEDAQKTVYRTDSDTMAVRFQELGQLIYSILVRLKWDETHLLHRVFHKQILKFRSDSYRSSPRAMYNSKMATY